jgi:hypothetical protein
VVVDVAKLSVGREDYYLREVANNREEYLTGHGESPGRWLGHGAATLGQHGTATTEAFVHMFHGRHPDTGALLGRAHGEAGVPAFDVVFRPTKSVSLLYGLGDAQVAGVVLEAHQQATEQALGYLEGQASSSASSARAACWAARVWAACESAGTSRPTRRRLELGGWARSISVRVCSACWRQRWRRGGRSSPAAPR